MLFFLIMLSHALYPIDGCLVVIQAKPPVVVFGFDAEVVITCTSSITETGRVSTLTQIQILSEGNPIAIASKTGGLQKVSSDPNIKVTGQFYENKNSTLSLAVSVSDGVALNAQYQCEAEGRDKRGITHTSSDAVYIITRNDPEIKAFIDKSHNTTNELQSCLHNANKTLTPPSIIFHPAAHFRNSRYYLSKAGYANSDQAEAMCEAYSGYLVEINDQMEYNFVVSLARQRYVEGMLISGTDQAKETVWVYQHSKKRVEYLNWAGKNPDNWLNDENCLTIHKKFDYKMNDLICVYRENTTFLCEMSSELK